MNVIWREARMDTIFYDAKPSIVDQRCWVKIGDGRFELTFDIGSPPAYVGKRAGNGHYRVVSPGSGSGTLHRFADDEILEGFWDLNGRRGFWRVTLSAVAALGAAVARIDPARAKAPPRPRKQVRVRRVAA